MTEQSEIKDEIIEQYPEKILDEIYIEMFKFAEENKYDGKLVFNWVFQNGKTIEDKMTIWAIYVSEITRYNTRIQVKNEDTLKLVKILE